ncbi:PP2C family protein-serine/threonine phosphatase [Undibacterium sp. SXout20W]|uniref:PP2C family protein-serine/threonine phosphatase n=1 Tax=Undibacterium sp. SXout20W TaxID=3413051 RepID=UPI003BF0F695
MDCKQCGEVLGVGSSFCEACGAANGVPATLTPDSQVEPQNIGQHGVPCLCGHDDFDVDGICDNCGRKQAYIARPVTIRLNDLTASATHRGLLHEENQDACAIFSKDGTLGLAVADGVSTACRAKEAAETAVTMALDVLQQNSQLAPEQRLQLAVRLANQSICDLPYDDQKLAEPEATLVLALIEEGQLHYAWVGDSRLYVIKQNAVLQLTEDDSWMNQQIKAGISVDAASKDRNAHCITQCLGMRDDTPDIHIANMPLDDDVNVVLCSDGFWNYCDSQEAMLALFDSTSSVAEQCERLVDYANRQGGHDNISVVLHRYYASEI